MSGSCVSSLRRLQAAVEKASGVAVPTLALTEALLDNLGADSLRFERPSLASHRDRLRNWQMADRVLMAEARGCKLEDLQRAYEIYSAQAVAADLPPLLFSTFRLRTYNLPGLQRKPEGRG